MKLFTIQYEDEMVIIPVRSKGPKFGPAAAHLHFRWSSLFFFSNAKRRVPRVVSGHCVTYNLYLDDDGYGKDLASEGGVAKPLQEGNEYAFYFREALQKSRAPPGGGILRFGLRCGPTSMQRKALACSTCMRPENAANDATNLEHNQTRSRTKIR